MLRPLSVLTAAVALGFASWAAASYHTFHIDEVYSNPSGTVQYIELHEIFGFNFQNFLTNAPDIRSSTHDFVFPSDLGSTNTANKDVLIATAGYAALPGAATPDYIIPNSFMNPAGDTLQYGSTGFDGVVDLTTYGTMPSNPLQSLNRVGTTGNTYTAGAATPENFAGVVGAIPEPASIGLLCGAGALLGLRRRRGSAAR